MQGLCRSKTVVGETPNLAARLQALAEPETVVIAAGTRRLVGDVFEYRDLGSVEVKGTAAPVWQSPCSRSIWMLVEPVFEGETHDLGALRLGRSVSDQRESRGRMTAQSLITSPRPRQEQQRNRPIPLFYSGEVFEARRSRWKASAPAVRENYGEFRYQRYILRDESKTEDYSWPT